MIANRRRFRLLLFTFALTTVATQWRSTVAWPDGAPCIHAAYESMNPLESVEHQGGLQVSERASEQKSCMLSICIEQLFFFHHLDVFHLDPSAICSSRRRPII